MASKRNGRPTSSRPGAMRSRTRKRCPGRRIDGSRRQFGHNSAMDRYERILTLHRLLKTARYPVSLQHLKDELGCSRATLYRDIAFLRDALGAPIESGEGEETSVRYAADEAERFELPGLWLTSEELAALLALNELLGRSDPGVLAGALAPFRAR